MDDTAARAACLGLQLMLDAVQSRTGDPVDAEAPVHIADAAWIARGALGGHRLTIGVVFIVPPAAEGSWYAAKDALEQRIGGSLNGGYILWAPSGAELPAREPGRSDFITTVETATGTLSPGDRGEVRFPVSLYLRKSDEEGGYVTARGGLAPHWARFTGRVFGHFQLDSTELNRPPAEEGYLSTLIDSIALSANALKLGETVTIEVDDAWPLQRLSSGQGLTVVGEPPGAELSMGAALRRSVRRTMQAIRGPMLDGPAGARLVGFIGPYASFKEQPVGTALLGMDPTLFAGLDMVLLAADGQAAPILDFTHSPILGEKAG